LRTLNLKYMVIKPLTDDMSSNAILPS